ncbi:SgcJ/EcaC family oxidoreductase [Phycicoccus endophyticus]|uniref:SgcJ/EcaC family oxidoreductase n=1 Tax=Phycicoccus endophyticus TaxID=1690220 RepID=A0A7G9R499_9MICO|nr:SgcJ/EcaC family oxidoreductase [Phycicoccus endophyticus]NHI18284.1 SgcJ/EcaC family oxidoreductase [Phycicoccus endophyticus]QNN50424.1 SgcJ/EcaC family oxidoreductase [Phycicoccus endophyticus]GGL25007.1 hypothetical protein GCM10012283_03910 [Phycicoccus endophyticus]
MTPAEEVARATEAAYDAAWNRADVDGLLSCLTDDAVLVNPSGEEARGRDQVRTVFEGLFAGWAAGSRHESRVVRADAVTDDVVVLDGVARLTGLGPDAPLAVGDDGVLVHEFTEVLVRRDGRWLLAHVRAHASRG